MKKCLYSYCMFHFFGGVATFVHHFKPLLHQQKSKSSSHSGQNARVTLHVGRGCPRCIHTVIHNHQLLNTQRGLTQRWYVPS